MIKNLIFLLVTTIVFSGCGPGVLRATDESLLPYVEQFRHEAEKRGIELPELNYLTIIVVPAESVPGLHGVCRTEEGTNAAFIRVKRKSIQISEAAVSHGEFATRVTMFHELAHCIMELEHEETVVPAYVNRPGLYYNGPMPISIMAPRYFGPAQEPVAELYWDRYLDQLFGLRANPFN